MNKEEKRIEHLKSGGNCAGCPFAYWEPYGTQRAYGHEQFGAWLCMWNADKCETQQARKEYK